MRQTVTLIVAWAMLGAAPFEARAGKPPISGITGEVTREAVTRLLVATPEGAGAPGAPPRLRLLMWIAFDFDAVALTAHAMRELDSVAGALNDPRLLAATFTLEGHTDARGNDAYNLRLSRRRAEAVVAYLRARGVAAHRLQAEGYGEYRLMRDYAPDHDRQRRVEIIGMMNAED